MKVNSTKYRKVIISLDLGKNGGHTNGGFGGRSIVAIRQAGRHGASTLALVLISILSTYFEVVHLVL